jgi:DNA-binding GntR family transcriptional regulator
MKGPYTTVATAFLEQTIARSAEKTANLAELRALLRRCRDAIALGNRDVNFVVALLDAIDAATEDKR